MTLDGVVRLYLSPTTGGSSGSSSFSSETAENAFYLGINLGQKLQQDFGSEITALRLKGETYNSIANQLEITELYAAPKQIAMEAVRWAVTGFTKVEGVTRKVESYEGLLPKDVNAAISDKNCYRWPEQEKWFVAYLALQPKYKGRFDLIAEKLNKKFPNSPRGTRTHKHVENIYYALKNGPYPRKKRSSSSSSS